MSKAEQNILLMLISKFEGSNVILTGENDEEIQIPKKMIPSGVSIGDKVTLNVLPEGEETEGKEKKAKEILNEILNA